MATRYKRADEVVPGDRVDYNIVTESRAYLPNPDVMWMIHGPGWAGRFIPRDSTVLVVERLVIHECPWEA